MAYQENLEGVTYDAGEDLSSDQYTFMKLDATDPSRVVKQDTAGASCVGVLRTVADEAGKAVTVDGSSGSKVKVKAGGTVAAGAKVQSDATGRAITAASGDHVQGYALEGGVVGQTITVLLLSEHILA